MESKRYQMKNYDGEGDYNPEAHLKYRLEYLEGQTATLVSAGKTDARKAKIVLANESVRIEDNLREIAVMNKLNKDVAVIVPTYWLQGPWLRASLSSCKKLGYFTLLSYDNHFWRTDKIEQVFPDPEVMGLADSVVIKHRTKLASVGFSYMWNVLYGMNLIAQWGFPYVFSMNGDCIMETPENFDQVLDMLGDGDIISCQYMPERRYCHTLSLVAKTDVYLAFLNEVSRTIYSKWGSSLERRLFEFIEDNDLKVVQVKNSAHNFKMPDPNSDWTRILGFRHLHAELRIRREERLLPVEKEHFDFGINERYVGGAEKPLYKFYTTGDKAHLEEWWGELK